MEKKIKSFSETVVDEALSISSTFMEVKNAVTQSLKTELLLAERLKAVNEDVSQLAGVIVTLSTMVKEQQLVINQLKLLINGASASRDSGMSMPAFAGKKIGKSN